MNILSKFGGRSLTLQMNSQKKEEKNTNNNDMTTEIFWAIEIPLEWIDTHKAYVTSITKHKRASRDYFSLIEL